ncbi:hypothetical protein HER21_41255, partial [Pseudomonas sp. BGM005]|nr:hypothetical protein [Pseudomonas sp. BG5]
YATRKISLRSEAARDFVALAGWAVEPPYDDFSYAGDLLKNRGFVVSRFWHPAARFTFTPQPDAHPEDRLMLIVVAEGELVVETSETRSIVPAGSIFL